jgi:ADP-heptose:LPS heptosyltransferase
MQAGKGDSDRLAVTADASNAASDGDRLVHRAAEYGRAGSLPRYGKPLPELTGKYRARNPVLVAALTVFDLLGRLHPKRSGLLPADRPIRLLVANWAHLGDVVAILPLLQYLARHPRIEKIGVLVGSWSQCIVSELPFLDKVHYLDHFLLDRGAGSRTEKMRRYFVRQSQVVREIRDSCYDVSIDLFGVFPPTHRLLWKAGIPNRIGFTCTGLGTYLTHPYDWPLDDEYILTKQLALLEPILGDETPTAFPAAYPDFVPTDLREHRLTPDRRYILMHIGVGDFRSWPLENWVELGRALQARGMDLVFTGARGVEAELAEDVAGKLKAQCVAGALSWNEFVTSVANAAAVISVDTVTGHLAACFGIPSIILLSGRWGSKFFRPNNTNALTLTHPVGCTPCYRSRGCAAMACVKLIPAVDVLAAFDQIDLRQRPRTQIFI